MSELKVKFHFGNAGGTQLFVSIDGRQALEEGPRWPGHCVYCRGFCKGATHNCEQRVFAESLKLTRGKR